MTLAQLRAKILKDTDIEDEDFIDDEELTGIFNNAIREAEAEIHKLGIEDQYFLAFTPMTLVDGTGEYDLPDDIYADKITGIHYANSDRRYEIRRFIGTKRFAEYLYFRTYGTSTTSYKYLIINNAATGPQISISPLAYESGQYGTIFYIRRAKELVDETDVCDIPFIDFVLQFARDQVINKERQMPDAPPSPKLQQQRQLMIDTLTEQVPDGNNIIEHDFSHYEEST